MSLTALERVCAQDSTASGDEASEESHDGNRRSGFEMITPGRDPSFESSVQLRANRLPNDDEPTALFAMDPDGDTLQSFDAIDLATECRHMWRIDQETLEIERCPGDPARYVHRAWVHLDFGAYEMAISDCSRAIVMDPSHSAAFVLRAFTYFLAGRFAECIVDCNRGLRLDHRDARAWQLRASARAALGDHKGAIGDYDEAIMRKPDSAALFRDRADLLIALGDLWGALDDATIACAMDPTDVQARKIRDLVRARLERCDSQSPAAAR